ncbi:MAG: calcium/sodium antiporter [Clostridia bacterium]|nr:calcium/sodium antiporter [Clostridia bacterium]
MSLINLLTFFIGLALLIFGGGLFVDGASSIARRFSISELLIGATVVSVGTTLPEVLVSASAALSGAGEIAYGNAIGSIICNTALIAALTIAIKPVSTDGEALKIPTLFFFIATAFYIFVSYSIGKFTRLFGVILLLLFIAYMAYTVISMRRDVILFETADAPDEKKPLDKLPLLTELKEELLGRRTSIVREIIILIIGAVMIAFGADFLVEAAEKIANALGVSQTLISLTIVALGTSLPELITAITALIKGHGALGVGNIIGANLFNLVLVSGVSMLISPFSLPTSTTLLNQNSTLVLDIPLMVGAMLILTIPTILKSRLSRWQGVTLLLLYGAFLTVQLIFVSPAM